MIAELELAKELNTTLADYQHSIDTALLDAKEATILSSSLLDFARANYDSSQVSFSSLRLDEILVESKFMVQDKDKDYRVSISFNYDLLHNAEDQEEILVMGNAYLLKVAFANLIENACKYSSDKHCLVDIIYHEGIAIVQVCDKGRGISSEDLPHIFELFYQSASSPGQHGHGIGLSIVQRIIDMHKGQLQVQSELGQGSTFTVQFNRIS